MRSTWSLTLLTNWQLYGYCWFLVLLYGATIMYCLCPQVPPEESNAVFDQEVFADAHMSSNNDDDRTLDDTAAENISDNEQANINSSCFDDVPFTSYESDVDDPCVPDDVLSQSDEKMIMMTKN